MKVEWQGKTTALVNLADVQRASTFPWNESKSARFLQVQKRPITEVICHHSGGNPHTGRIGVDAIARFATAAKSKGGRGWPGFPYHFAIPSTPIQDELGRNIVYRVWEDDWRIWHTGGFHNQHGVGVVVVGTYKSGAHPGGAEAPSKEAMSSMQELILDYLLPRYGLDPRRNLFTHSEFGKPACPGDAVTSWVESFRKTGNGPSLLDVQKKLKALGFDPGKLDGLWGPTTRTAVVKFQKSSGLVPDGILGPKTLRKLSLV